MPSLTPNAHPQRTHTHTYKHPRTRAQWYMLGMGDDYRVVAYKGDTQQGPYEGAFVYTKEVDGLKDAGLRAKVDAAVKAGGLDPNQMQVM